MRPSALRARSSTDHIDQSKETNAMRIIINDVVTYTFDVDATQLARELHITPSKLEALSDDELWDQVAST